MISDLTAIEEYPLLSGYRKVTEYATGFERGVQPDWLVNNVTGGGSVTYETTDSGRARINTGTSATGDGAEIQIGADGSGVEIDFDEYDAILLETVSQSTDDRATLDQHQSVLYGSGSANIAVSRKNDEVIIDNSGVTSYNNAAKDRTAVPIRETIIWDIAHEELRVLVGGMMSEVIAYSDVPAPSEGYLVVPHKLLTADTSADREAYLYNMRFALYEQ